MGMMPQYLVVGDGDFSFSLSLACKYSCKPGEPLDTTKIVATSLETEDEVAVRPGTPEIIWELQEMGVVVLHGVDGTHLETHPWFSERKQSGFDRIIFNFPHTGGKGNIERNRALLRDFFKSAVGFLNPAGEIRVALCQGQGGTLVDCTKRGYGNTWKIVEMAAEAGLFLTAVRPFAVKEHPSYAPTGYRGQCKGFLLEGALTHVFSLPLPSDSIAPWPSESWEEYCTHCSTFDSATRESFSVSVANDFQAFLSHPLLAQSWHPVLLVSSLLEGALKQTVHTCPWNSVESDRNERVKVHAFPSTCIPHKEPGVVQVPTVAVEVEPPFSVAPPVTLATAKTAQPLSLACQPTIECELPALAKTVFERPLDQRSLLTHSPELRGAPSVGQEIETGDSVLRLLSCPVLKNTPISYQHLPLTHELLGIFPLYSKSFESVCADLEGAVSFAIDNVLAQSQSTHRRPCLFWCPAGIDGQLHLSCCKELKCSVQSSHDEVTIAKCGLFCGSKTLQEDETLCACNRDGVLAAFTVDLNCLALLFWGIEDARLLWSNDTRFLAQFINKNPLEIVFEPFNTFAPSYSHDISFWCNSCSDGCQTQSHGQSSDSLLPLSVSPRVPFCEQKLVSILWRISGAQAVSLSCIDTYSPPGSDRTSRCYRIVYRSVLGALSASGARNLQMELRKELQQRMDIELR